MGRLILPFSKARDERLKFGGALKPFKLRENRFLIFSKANPHKVSDASRFVSLKAISLRSTPGTCKRHSDFYTFVSMLKVNHLRSLTCILLVCFLFVPLISRAFQQESTEQNIKKSGYSKHTSAASSKAEGQLICEEKEKEEKSSDDFSDSLPVIYLLSELAYAPVAKESPRHPTKVFPFCGSLPLYLGKHSLLI